jgi:uncharacterized protein (DUF1330 family)
MAPRPAALTRRAAPAAVLTDRDAVMRGCRAFIVRGGAFECMEGVARERNVVVEFADVATAFACHGSEDYQRAMKIRQAHADTDFLIVEGVA